MIEKEKIWIKKWLIKANEDIEVIEDLCKLHPTHYTGSICLHSQQAVEKFFKAFLIYHGVDFERTHNLYFLYKECIKFEQLDIDLVLLKKLIYYATDGRYPDDIDFPDLKETLEYKALALQVKSLIEKKIILD